MNRELSPFIGDRFILKQKWTDWPGFFAFHYSALAYVAYFSPLAGALQKLLYVFRGPFYEYDRL